MVEGHDGACERGRPISRRDALRRGAIGVGGVLLPGVLTACGHGAGTSSVPAPTTTAATALKPFDPNVPAGSAPSGLAKVFGFPGSFDDAQSVAFGSAIKRACSDRDLDYVVAVANGDMAKIADQTQQMFARDICAMFQYPFEEPATRPLAQQALDKGMAVFAFSRPYSTMQYIEDEGAVGTTIGRAAVKWIGENLDGKAQVVHFNNDKNEPTSIPRHKATLAELTKGGPGIRVVADVSEQGGTEPSANAFATVLQAHPDVNVVIGTEFAGVGAFTVLDSKGKGNDPKIYISVLAAADDALSEIASGNSAIKAGFLYPWPLLGYATGQFAADWLEGKSIPRLGMPPNGAVIEVSSPEAVAQYKAAMKDPAKTWNDPTARAKYVTYLGNISYDQRSTYWRRAASLPRTGTG